MATHLILCDFRHFLCHPLRHTWSKINKERGGKCPMKSKQSATPSKKAAAASKFLTVQSLFLFLIFPVILLINCFLMLQYVYTLYGSPFPAVYVIMTLLLFFLILSVYVFQKQYSKKHTSQSYQELLSMQQYQKKHYEMVQQQRNHLENIKNTFGTQLSNICSLLDAGQLSEASSLLQSLTKEIESTKEYPFCPNPIINAVLSNKEQVCQKYQITFHADLQISSCDSVNKLHLCSIFSNLMDNAIEASKALALPADRYIQLTARQNGDYLHIKIKNSSPPLASPKKGHGYGQKILTDIALKYSGEFRTDYENHTYEAYLCIRMP